VSNMMTNCIINWEGNGLPARTEDNNVWCLPVCHPQVLRIRLHKTLLLPVDLYKRGGTWLSLTLREEQTEYV